MSDKTTGLPQGRRDLIKAGIAAGALTALAPWVSEPALAEPAGRAAKQNHDPGLDRQPRRPLGRFRPVERLLHRLQPPERPQPDLRAAGLLQRLRRQDLHVAGRKLQLHARLQAADDQDPLRHQMERRRPVQRRGRRLHAQHPARLRPQGEMGRRRAAGGGEGDRDRRQYGRGGLQDPVAALLLLHDLQVRHRRLHRAEAYLRRSGLDHLQALRHRQGLAGQHRAMAGDQRLAAAEGLRPPPDLVGRRGRARAAAAGAAQHLAARHRRAADGAGDDHQPDRCQRRPAARDVPDHLPAERQDHHPCRPQAALRLCRLVADLALRQQRGEAVRRPRHPLGAQLLHRPHATDRRGLFRRQRRPRRCRCRPTSRCSPISTR